MKHEAQEATEQTIHTIIMTYNFKSHNIKKLCEVGRSILDCILVNLEIHFLVVLERVTDFLLAVPNIAHER